MAFVPTVPYADTAYANAYMEERIEASEWSAASMTNDLKDKYLKFATRYIDTLPFIGDKTDVDQVRQFPRNGDSAIPTEVMDACCEAALAMIKGNSIENLQKKAGIVSESVGDASVSYNDNGAQQLMEDNFGTISPMVYRLLAGWLRDPDVFPMERV